MEAVIDTKEGWFVRFGTYSFLGKEGMSKSLEDVVFFSSKEEAEVKAIEISKNYPLAEVSVSSMTKQVKVYTNMTNNDVLYKKGIMS